MEVQLPRLLFLSMDWYRTKDPRVPLAMASIQTSFQKNGPKNLQAEFVSFDLAADDFDVDQVIALLREYQPQYFAMGVYIWNEKETQRILAAIGRHHPAMVVILGGPQITFGNSSLVTEYPFVNFFIKGAGEEPFAWLMCRLANEQNLVAEELKTMAIYTPELLQGDRCEKVFSSDLAMLESPYLSGILPLDQNQSFVRWETMRGCPYRCNFCQFKSEGVRPLKFGQDRIAQELALFHSKQIAEIHVLDAIFNLQKSHYLSILETIESLNMSAKFYFQCRLELLLHSGGRELLEFCRRYGNVRLEFGVQTFNEIESGATKRGNRMQEIGQAIALVREYEVEFDLHLIFGLPNQSIVDFQRSYEIAVGYKPSGLYLYPLNLLKGTELYDEAIQHGYVWDAENYNILQKSNWMDAFEIKILHELAAQVNGLSKQRAAGCHFPSFPMIARKAA